MSRDSRNARNAIACIVPLPVNPAGTARGAVSIRIVEAPEIATAECGACAALSRM